MLLSIMSLMIGAVLGLFVAGLLAASRKNSEIDRRLEELGADRTFGPRLHDLTP